jgi:hypothetical protein
MSAPGDYGREENDEQQRRIQAAAAQAQQDAEKQDEEAMARRRKGPRPFDQRTLDVDYDRKPPTEDGGMITPHQSMMKGGMPHRDMMTRPKGKFRVGLGRVREGIESRVERVPGYSRVRSTVEGELERRRQEDQRVMELRDEYIAIRAKSKSTTSARNEFIHRHSLREYAKLTPYLAREAAVKKRIELKEKAAEKSVTTQQSPRGTVPLPMFSPRPSASVMPGLSSPGIPGGVRLLPRSNAHFASIPGGLRLLPRGNSSFATIRPVLGFLGTPRVNRGFIPVRAKKVQVAPTRQPEPMIGRGVFSVAGWKPKAAYQAKQKQRTGFGFGMMGLRMGVPPKKQVRKRRRP